MKKIIFLLILVSVISITIFAQYTPELNRYRKRVAIELNSKADILQLKKMAIDIDYCSVFDGVKIYAYCTPEEVNMLKSFGYKVNYAPVIIGKNTRGYSYHNYEDLTRELKELAQKYPKIAKLESIGKSVQGRELWIMKISDNVNVDEAEPEVKYISTMHGDEPVGQELMIYLIRLLLEKYGKDEFITKLVNDLEIWIMPNMNPDGTALHRRYNANWYDLNRNFPDFEDDPNNTPEGRPTEVQHMMRFTAKHNFSISINFHTGAVVVNYPWDTKPGDVPDIALTKYLALGYSKRNKPMYNSPYFKNGITNGYDWYEVNGGMQDWNYYWYSDLELTVELSQRKWPDADTLPKYWDDNRESLLWYLSQARRGVHGFVKDKKTGEPIRAKINVLEINKPVYSSYNLGDYHRVLLPGTYTLEFSAKGYKTKTIKNVVVNDTLEPTILNVELEPLK